VLALPQHAQILVITIALDSGCWVEAQMPTERKSGISFFLSFFLGITKEIVF
jgi:hypothetical protein